MKAFLLRKKDGGVGDMITCMITVMIAAVIIFTAIDTYRQVNVASTLKSIERKYMFKLETQGYLTAEDTALLIEDLVNNHADRDSISILGTTTAPVGYGETVVLNITGNIIGMPNRIGIKGFFAGWETEDGGTKFKIHQESTAKN